MIQNWLALMISRPSTDQDTPLASRDSGAWMAAMRYICNAGMHHQIVAILPSFIPPSTTEPNLLASNKTNLPIAIMAAEVDKSTVEDSSPNSPEEKRKETQKLPTVIGAAAAGIVAVAGTAHFYHSSKHWCPSGGDLQCG